MTRGQKGVSLGRLSCPMSILAWQGTGKNDQEDSMNTLELMDSCASSYSKTDRAIYEAVRKFPDNFAQMSVTQLSDAAGFSKPALTRFAQRLGFSGFVEFQYQFAQDLEELRSRTDAPTNAEVYGGLLRAVDERLDRNQVLRLIERMRASRCTYLMGYNLARIPAEELNIALQFQNDIHAVLPQVDVPPHFLEDDLLLIYSAVGGSSYKGLLNEFKMGRNTKPYMVLVTTNPKHPLRRNFDESFVLPTASLASTHHTVLSDTFAFLMFNDILSETLAEDDRRNDRNS